LWARTTAMTERKAESGLGGIGASEVREVKEVKA
jgi:hypothetical protein